MKCSYYLLGDEVFVFIYFSVKLVVKVRPPQTMSSAHFLQVKDHFLA